MNIAEELAKANLSQEQYEECLQTIIDKKNGVNDIDWQEICDKFGLNVSNETLRRIHCGIWGGAFVAEYFRNKDSHEQKPGATTVNTVPETTCNVETTFNKDGTLSSRRVVQMSEAESKDPAFVLQAHGYDPEEWELVSAKNTIRQAISGTEGTVTLYASFVTVKPIKKRDVSLKRIETFFNKLDRTYSLPKIEDNWSYQNGDKMLLIDIADLHMNLQASMFTTGNEYNCDIAEKLFFGVIEDVLTRTRHYELNEIVFVIGGDMLNGDNLQGATTRGTQQISDVHYYDAYERLCTMTIQAIDVLKECCKVSVIYTKGNHDELAGFKLAKYIDAWFRSETRVEVDYQPYPRKYKMYGKTLLCFAHDGNTAKLPMIIADEARTYWSDAETVEVFLQHLHTEQILKEENNIRIQRLPTISAKSKWSVDQGYGSKRQCKSFVFDKEYGMMDVLYTPIRMIE